jgi:hypothetical protein
MKRQALFLAIAMVILGSTTALASRFYNGITTEVVDTYSRDVNLSNNATVMSFVSSMVSSWNGTVLFNKTNGFQWLDPNVWDEDFQDAGLNGFDDSGFDFNQSSISLYAGHGDCQDDPLGEPSNITLQTCTTSSQCTNPAGYSNQVMPGRCVWSPPSPTAGYCMYTPVKGKAFELNNTHDGPDHWHSLWDFRWHLGEDPMNTFTNTWGSDGGVNLVIFYSSCSLRPGSWDQQFSSGFWNGVEVVEAVVPTVPEQYAYYNDIDSTNMPAYLGSSHFNNPGGLVVYAWETAFNQTGGGGPCAYGGGYKGVYGCGAAVSVYRGKSLQDISVQNNLTWVGLQSDASKPYGTQVTWATWTCNYDCSSTGHPIYR